MVSKISSLLKNKIFINGMWLYVLQFFNTIMPLLTLPYVTRVLGSSQYGVFSFSLTFVTYFQVIVEYGFNLSGSRKIALTSTRDEQSKIFTSITITKLLLCLISFIVMVSISLVLNLDKEQFFSILVLYTMVIGTAIQQIWLFQGLQVMKFITIINVFSRVISVMLIFGLVKHSNQVYLYCALYAITSLLNGIFSALITRYKLKIRFTKITIKDIFIELKEGWNTFTTSAMSVIFSGIGVMVLGFTNSSNNTIGVYSAIQKIPYMMIMFFAPISQAIFPRVSQQFSISFDKGIDSVRKISKVVVPIVAIVSLLLMLFSDLIVSLVYGEQYSTYYLLMIPLVCWFFLSILNNFLGIQNLVASGHQKEYSTAFKISALVIILSNILLGYIWGAYGVAYATLFSEFILTISLAYQNKKVKNKFRYNR
ncbi:flippase [Bacillus cereus group sp. BfR-BA-01310]|uniref:flippase n=1 Tax=Bacillus cereus group sp. BfR-BA-01310 TaxID=2920287 RepID=UPI001F58A43B|nr:flippase [Bacillus cereus group sp. BfR-BA-01310]